MEKFFKFLESMKVIFFIFLTILVLWVGYKAYNLFKVGITTEKIEEFDMNSWKLLPAQKIIISEIDGEMKGRIGYRKIIESNFLGGRIDTMPWWFPGSKFVDLNGLVVVPVGYNLMEGDRLFSENAKGVLRETKDSLVLMITTNYQEPKVLGNNLRTIPVQNNSWFTGSVQVEDFFEYLDSATTNVVQETVRKENDYFVDNYANTILGITQEVLQVIADGKGVAVIVVINNNQYRDVSFVEKEMKVVIPVDKTLPL